MTPQKIRPNGKITISYSVLAGTVAGLNVLCSEDHRYPGQMMDYLVEKELAERGIKILEEKTDEQMQS